MPIDFTEFQKTEDAALKPKRQEKPKKAKKMVHHYHLLYLLTQQELPVNTEVFTINVDGRVLGFFVSPKEKGILTKQQAQKTPQELLELAGVMEIPSIPANTIVVQGDSVLYTPLL